MLANQLGIMPTNKMIATAVVTIVFYFLGIPYTPILTDAFAVLLSLGIGLAAAWFVPDFENKPRNNPKE